MFIRVLLSIAIVFQPVLGYSQSSKKSPSEPPKTRTIFADTPEEIAIAQQKVAEHIARAKEQGQEVDYHIITHDPEHLQTLHPVPASLRETVEFIKLNESDYERFLDRVDELVNNSKDIAKDKIKAIQRKLKKMVLVFSEHPKTYQWTFSITRGAVTAYALNKSLQALGYNETYSLFTAVLVGTASGTIQKLGKQYLHWLNRKGLTHKSLKGLVTAFSKLRGKTINPTELDNSKALEFSQGIIKWVFTEWFFLGLIAGSMAALGEPMHSTWAAALLSVMTTGFAAYWSQGIWDSGISKKLNLNHKLAGQKYLYETDTPSNQKYIESIAWHDFKSLLVLMGVAVTTNIGAVFAMNEADLFYKGLGQAIIGTMAVAGLPYYAHVQLKENPNFIKEIIAKAKKPFQKLGCALSLTKTQ